MFVVCNPLHLFVFTLSTTIISAFTFATNLSQPERPNLSIKGKLNPSTNHTNTSSKNLSLNPTFFYFQTLCFPFENWEQSLQRLEESQDFQEEARWMLLSYSQQVWYMVHRQK